MEMDELPAELSHILKFKFESSLPVELFCLEATKIEVKGIDVCIEWLVYFT